MPTTSDFATRYMITAARSSRIYTREMLLNATMRDKVMIQALGVKRAQVAAVLDDDVFMRSRCGMTPSAVSQDAIREAFHRANVAG